MVNLNHLVGFTVSLTAMLDSVGQYTDDNHKTHKTRLLKYIMFNGYMIQDHAWVTETPLFKDINHEDEFTFKATVKRYGKKFRFTNISKVAIC